MKFSIIVPVYNASEYLDRCINCITSQTYSDWELILIDDGSKDNSWEIIQKYQAEDSRIIGIHQENAGPGKARNVGIESVTGDYIVFIDADDYVDLDYLRLVEPLAKENDLVFIDTLRVDLDGGVSKAEIMSENRYCDKDEIIRAMMTGKIPWGGWRKTYSVKLLRDNGICYSDIKIGEEALFSFRALSCAKNIGFLDAKPVYMYETHSQSQSNLKMDDPWGPTYQVMRDYMVENGLYEKYADTLNAFNIVSTIVSIDRITLNYTGRDVKRHAKERIALYKERRDPQYPLDKHSMDKKARIVYPLLKMNLVSMIILICNMRRKLKR